MKLRLLAAALALTAIGCRSDDAVTPPDLSTTDGLMARYVALGNSITAGFQSGGINDSTQAQSYAVLVAQQANAPFFVPFLNRPGCPGPYTVNSTVPQQRVGGGGGASCALRAGNAYPYVSNLAVPGSRVQGLIDTTSANALTQLVLGGETQVQAMRRASPTFVSLWIGNNDVLGALTALPPLDPGNIALITPQGQFEAAYGAILQQIDATGAEAVLIGVADVASIPYGIPGSVIWCLKTGVCPGVPGQLAPVVPLTVTSTCAPLATGIPGAEGDSVLVPWPVAVPAIAAAAQGQPRTIDCGDDATTIVSGEFLALKNAVQGYNAYIQAQAAARGWAYFDPNPTLLAAKADVASGRVATFPQLPGGPDQPNVLFGTWFSLDGVHPSATAHRVVADSVISAINANYGTAIPLVGP